MKVIAHRGVCTEELENSWAAFHRSVEIGAERIELDVHLTADGHLVIVHDEDLQRTAGINRRVSEMTRAEIEQSAVLKNGEKLPFLDELFAKLLPSIEINVEIKSEGRATVEKVGQLIRSQSLASKVVVSSFSEETCAWMTKDFPGIEVALLWDRSLWWPGAFRAGPERFMKTHGIRIFHPEARLVTPKLVDRCKELGWLVYPYVGLRDEAEKEKLWSYLMTVGVDGLCTNYPRQMKLWLKEAKDDEERFHKDRIVVRPTS